MTKPRGTLTAYMEDVARLTVERNEARAEIARLRAALEPAVTYHRAYMAGGNDGCTNPISSGSHDDHDCLVSLHARMLAAVGALVVSPGAEPREGG